MMKEHEGGAHLANELRLHSAYSATATSVATLETNISACEQGDPCSRPLQRREVASTCQERKPERLLLNNQVLYTPTELSVIV